MNRMPNKISKQEKFQRNEIVRQMEELNKTNAKAKDMNNGHWTYMAWLQSTYTSVNPLNVLELQGNLQVVILLTVCIYRIDKHWNIEHVEHIE